jgi:hypothetical protein
MTVKKKYNIGDTVWVYGITNGRSTEGKIVQWFKVPVEGWDNNTVHYVVAIPTEIEYLLEVRTWETISQTKDGHVGSLREAFEDPDAARRMLARTGVKFISDADADYDGDGHDGMGSFANEDDIDPDLIHAAMERAQKDVSHTPLMIKDAKPKRRNFTRKKKV